MSSGFATNDVVGAAPVERDAAPVGAASAKRDAAPVGAASANRDIVAERPTLPTSGTATESVYPTEFTGTARLSAESPAEDVLDKVSDAQRAVVARVRAKLAELGAADAEVGVEALPPIGAVLGDRRHSAEAIITVATKRAVDDHVRLGRLSQAIMQALRLLADDWVGNRNVYVFRESHSARFRQTRADEIADRLRIAALRMARARAEASAAALGVRVVRPLRVSSDGEETVHAGRGARAASMTMYDGDAAAAPAAETLDVALQPDRFEQTVHCTWEIE